MLKVAPVPLAGDPPVAVHAKVVGCVSPDAVAVQDTAAFTVPVVGQLIVTVRGDPAVIEIVADAVAVFALASVTVTLTVNEPFVA